MSDTPEKSTITITDELVIKYLQDHPDFFTQNPELLSEIEVPHSSGDAVSLVERQVSILREQNEQTRKRMHELIEIARQNEELARRMHQLALTLMDSGSPRDIFGVLYDNLKRNFKADRVSVRLFAEPAFVDSYAGEEFAGPNMKEEALFSSIIEKRLPLSGKLKKQQQVFLFGDKGDDVESAVLVPLHGLKWGGILAIGSKDANRFQAGMGVELLANMGEVLSFILKPWIAEN